MVYCPFCWPHPILLWLMVIKTYIDDTQPLVNQHNYGTTLILQGRSTIKGRSTNKYYIILPSNLYIAMENHPFWIAQSTNSMGAHRKRGACKSSSLASGGSQEILSGCHKNTWIFSTTTLGHSHDGYIGSMVLLYMVCHGSHQQKPPLCYHI